MKPCQVCGVVHYVEVCPAFAKAGRECGPGITSEALYRAEQEKRDQQEKRS